LREAASHKEGYKLQASSYKKKILDNNDSFLKLIA